mmetsp:Transcript_89974/g.205575  ORF Transcript_89974/g.205575 Transcript_89974/m.205575 type:complete len:260 (-) Transcript_89974:1101-1880(-)
MVTKRLQPRWAAPSNAQQLPRLRPRRYRKRQGLLCCAERGRRSLLPSTSITIWLRWACHSSSRLARFTTSSGGGRHLSISLARIPRTCTWTGSGKKNKLFFVSTKNVAIADVTSIVKDAWYSHSPWPKMAPEPNHCPGWRSEKIVGATPAEAGSMTTLHDPLAKINITGGRSPARTTLSPYCLLISSMCPAKDESCGPLHSRKKLAFLSRLILSTASWPTVRLNMSKYRETLILNKNESSCAWTEAFLVGTRPSPLGRC